MSTLGLIDLPFELHHKIALFLPSSARADMCLVSQELCAVYQLALFEHVVLLNKELHKTCMATLNSKHELAAQIHNITTSTSLSDWPLNILSRLSALTLKISSTDLPLDLDAGIPPFTGSLPHTPVLRTLGQLQSLVLQFGGGFWVTPAILWRFLASVPQRLKELCVDVECFVIGPPPACVKQVELSDLRVLKLRGCRSAVTCLLSTLGSFPSPWIIGTELRSLTLVGFMYTATAALFQPHAGRLEFLDVSGLSLMSSEHGPPNSSALADDPRVAQFFASLSNLRHLRISDGQFVPAFFDGPGKTSLELLTVSLKDTRVFFDRRLVRTLVKEFVNGFIAAVPSSSVCLQLCIKPANKPAAQLFAQEITSLPRVTVELCVHEGKHLPHYH
uniref:F-box domain-containing protein n=1 Tax=Mycena chlorophos TaxID=658473 RepID=A0ABQ0KZQ1_MYCCL|nr:predicted protein [Mycena chlorophos]